METDGAASCLSSGIPDMSLRIGAIGGWACIGLANGTATALDAVEGGLMREEVPLESFR